MSHATQSHPVNFFPDFHSILSLLFSAEDGKTFLAEQVEDCGPLIDTDATPGCKLLPAPEDIKELEFPDCCPQYDCEEGTEIVFVNATAPATA